MLMAFSRYDPNFFTEGRPPKKARSTCLFETAISEAKIRCQCRGKIVQDSGVKLYQLD